MKAYKLAKTSIIKKTFMKAPLNYETPKALLKNYKELESNLIYLIIKIRPNICYAVSWFGQFSSNPINKHYTQLKQVFRYIKGTTDIKIAYERDKNITINVWTDTIWIKDIDDKKLINVYIFRSAGVSII